MLLRIIYVLPRFVDRWALNLIQSSCSHSVKRIPPKCLAELTELAYTTIKSLTAHMLIYYALSVRVFPRPGV
jgi:hypothetical protein